MNGYFKGKKFHYKSQRIAAQLFNAMYTERMFNNNPVYGSASTDETITDWLEDYNPQLYKRVINSSNYWPIIESCVFQYIDTFPQDFDHSDD